MRAQSHQQAIEEVQQMLGERIGELTAVSGSKALNMWQAEAALRLNANKCLENAQEIVEWRRQQDEIAAEAGGLRK